VDVSGGSARHVAVISGLLKISLYGHDGCAGIQLNLEFPLVLRVPDKPYQGIVLFFSPFFRDAGLERRVVVAGVRFFRFLALVLRFLFDMNVTDDSVIYTLNCTPVSNQFVFFVPVHEIIVSYVLTGLW
jgi:hypothetical protein